MVEVKEGRMLQSIQDGVDAYQKIRLSSLETNLER